MLITQHEKNLLKHKKSIILLLLIPALIYFWPASLYGDSDYIILVGNSMLPTMEPGSLVFVKKQPQYEISEIVAFTDSTGKHIVHRIIENSDERIVTQGDNNITRKKSPQTQEKHNSPFTNSSLNLFLASFALWRVRLYHISGK